MQAPRPARLSRAAPPSATSSSPGDPTLSAAKPDGWHESGSCATMPPYAKLRPAEKSKRWLEPKWRTDLTNVSLANAREPPPTGPTHPTRRDKTIVTYTTSCSLTQSPSSHKPSHPPDDDDSFYHSCRMRVGPCPTRLDRDGAGASRARQPSPPLRVQLLSESEGEAAADCLRCGRQRLQIM